MMTCRAGRSSGTFLILMILIMSLALIILTTACEPVSGGGKSKAFGGTVYNDARSPTQVVYYTSWPAPGNTPPKKGGKLLKAGHHTSDSIDVDGFCIRGANALVKIDPLGGDGVLMEKGECKKISDYQTAYVKLLTMSN